ncbi:5-methylorsellinic acid synthase [Paramyrothecium foliicola]|nr:5-methylorsellinic acid synthase [Paramyrothecium foliicola]
MGSTLCLKDDAKQDVPPQAVAVVGMACRFPGASSPEEYWALLEEGRSMVGNPPEGRFPTQSDWRSSAKSTFHGNYINDVESFDNEFFKRSGREAASMDPQQRLLLEVAYEALQSAGFFAPPDREQDVGCFIGACSSDYNDNVASHAPNAYSTLGTLRAFLSGRLSHTFGLLGPSITYDTACSSSTVAIDAACKAVLLGDCKVALAGGASIFTSPYFFQNLSAAGFLSRTGASKAFDADADGYCRGEGVGIVVLKGLARAIEDGDHILGTILSTSVVQSNNVVPITVPYSQSQAALHRKVLRQARVTADEITYLEAHGTGTPVGDFNEFESIKETFGSGTRKRPLHFASVKGNIGHTEAASGVAGLIKVLLMMHHRKIPMQANHVRLNPKINLVPGQLVIPTRMVEWDASNLLALINNYGAAGSLAAMLVKEAPKARYAQDHRPKHKYPFLIGGQSQASLVRNCSKLKEFISSSQRLSQANPNSLADLAFNLNNTQNIDLTSIFAGTASTIEDLDKQLGNIIANPGLSLDRQTQNTKPVVLVFGGQTSRCARINRSIYCSSKIFRRYLDDCDTTLQIQGHPTLYPGIFSMEPIDDIVAQQARQFSVQYASAMTWMACGLKVDCILGHSFGQLVALAVSGVLSLIDAVKLVCGRGALLRDLWGPEKGAMIALNTDRETSEMLIAAASRGRLQSEIEVACYNGPKSHVLVGSVKEIESVAAIARDSGIRHKVLDMTHGFHSRFCDVITDSLEKIATDLTYNEPKIPVETCSRGESWSAATPRLIASHTRTAVYFEEAVKRIESRLGACTWLEAGSNSSVIEMARRVILDTDSPLGPSHLFCPANFSQDDAVDGLAGIASTLWQHGYAVRFWPFHRVQSQQYGSLCLPPYQFEKKKHWLDFKLANETDGTKAAPNPQDTKPVLISFAKFRDSTRKQALFTVDTRSVEWQTVVSGHSVLKTPLCPAPLYLELVFQALKELADKLNLSCTTFPRFSDFRVPRGLGINHSEAIMLELHQSDSAASKFEFTFHSQGLESPLTGSSTVYATGNVEAISSKESKNITAEFNRLGRLIGHQDMNKVDRGSMNNSVQGPIIYNLFSKVMDYEDFYKGVSSIASSADLTMGTFVLPEKQPPATKTMLLNPVAQDNIYQILGIQLNCLEQCSPEEVYVFTSVERVQFATNWSDLKHNTCEVIAMPVVQDDKDRTYDLLVRDAVSRKLIFIALGTTFHRVRTSSLSRIISPTNKSARNHLARQSTIADVKPLQMPQTTSGSHVDGDFKVKFQSLVSSLTDIPAHKFQGQARMEDLGIDSLMATEITRESSRIFDISLSYDDIQTLLMNSPSITEPISRQQSAQSSNLRYSLTPSSATIGIHEAQLNGYSNQQSILRSSNEDVLSHLAELLATHLGCRADSILRSTVLAELGVDSLLWIEIMDDLEKSLGICVDLSVLQVDSTYGDLAGLVINAIAEAQGQAKADAWATSALDLPTEPRATESTSTFKENLPALRSSQNSQYHQVGGTETFVYKYTDQNLPLKADIYYPSEVQAKSHKYWTAALIIHGGGHVMLSRKDVSKRQIRLLLDHGVLPISIDYRLCPETTILKGPLVDVSDAYAWVLNVLPSLKLSCNSVNIVPGKAFAVGWSTGGTLAMSLAWTSMPRGLPPPEAILTFYCPTDYEDQFWQRPNIPEHSAGFMNDAYNVFDALHPAPIASYNVDSSLPLRDGWMAPRDARSRLVLHMNWRGQTLPVLFGGLVSAKERCVDLPAQMLQLEQPPKEVVQQASPYAQIIKGNYKSPTYIVSGTSDDLIPFKQVQRTADALRQSGLESGVTLIPGAPHLYDLHADRDGTMWEATLKGYQFLFDRL